MQWVLKYICERLRKRQHSDVAVCCVTVPHVRNALKRTESSASRGMESMYFKFSDKVIRSKVDKAHLWLYLNSVSSAKLSRNATVWIHVFKVLHPPAFQ